MTNRSILVIGHGSRVPEAVGEFNGFIEAFSAHIEQPVRACFLELVDPNVTTGLTKAAEHVGDGGEVIVLPMFLGAARHQKNDVPASIQWTRAQFPGVTYRYGTPLAPHAQLVELLSLRVGQTIADAPDAFPPEETAVLVVGRGSSDPTSNSEVARTAYLLYERRPYVAVMYAFRAVARPNISDGLQRCAALGAKQVIVVPYILFTGKVIEDIRSASRKTGDKLGVQVLHALYLGVHPLLLDVAAQRLQDAIDGTANMTCDICKYRYPMAGYEHQVGQPQEAH